MAAAFSLKLISELIYIVYARVMASAVRADRQLAERLVYSAPTTRD
jgi:hypothetical protein